MRFADVASIALEEAFGRQRRRHGDRPRTSCRTRSAGTAVIGLAPIRGSSRSIARAGLRTPGANADTRSTRTRVTYPGGGSARREDHVRPEVRPRESLEQVGGTALGDARGAVDDGSSRSPQGLTTVDSTLTATRGSRRRSRSLRWSSSVPKTISPSSMPTQAALDLRGALRVERHDRRDGIGGRQLERGRREDVVTRPP